MAAHADFAIWSTACEGAYAEPGTFKLAYAGNRADAISAIIEGDVVASAVLRLKLPWSGQLATLLDKLTAIVGGGLERARSWPKSPRALSAVLRRAAPLLNEQGLAVTPPRPNDKTRTWEIRRLSDLGEDARDQQPEQPGQPSHTDYSNRHSNLGLDDGLGGCQTGKPQQPDQQPAAKSRSGKFLSRMNRM